MARIPFATPGDIAANERPEYEAFVQERGSAPDSGPYALLLHMPRVARKMEALRLSLRGEASVPQNVQELVMLTVARELDCPYIWYAHAAAAREIGVSREIVDAIREKRIPSGLDTGEQAAVDFARELLRNRRVGQSVFDRATVCFGRRGTLALTSLIGCYGVLAYLMGAYELEAPAHATEPPLPV
jgi:4-carboxymuconolactone decarboxylase